MRILQVTSHLDIGGITRYVLSLAQELQARGHRVILAADGGHLEARAAALGVPHWRLPLHTSAEWSPRVFRAGRQLAARVREEPVDIIHAHTRVAQVVADRLARQFRIPYVTTWHGVFKRRLGRRLWPCMGDVTIAISPFVREHLLRDFHVPDARARLIYNGIDTAHGAAPPDASALQAFRERWHLPPGHPVIGGIGRMASGRVKGFDLILMAASLLRATVPGLHVLLVGDGPRRPFLEQVARRLGVHDCVQFVGTAEDVRIPLALMDVFVFPSRWPEGFGLTLVEAMVAGKPVVAMRNGAVEDIVEHEVSGLLVPPEDAAGLAQSVIRLLKDRLLAERLGRAAQARVRDAFSLDRMATQIEAVYREVLAAHRTAQGAFRQG